MNLQNLLSKVEPISPGFYGIGAGPGDPELLTIKAVRVLQASHIIFVPRSGIKKVSLAAVIIDSVVPEGGPPGGIREITFPMTRDEAELEEHWRKAAEEVMTSICDDKVISFVTLGDPCFYSTFFYLYRAMLAIDSGTEAAIIPGISAVNLAAARLGVPLSLGDDRIAILPLPEKVEGLSAVLQEFETVVIMKVGNRLKELTSYLEMNDLLSQSVFISRAGFDNEYAVRDMSRIDPETKGYLAVCIISRRRFP